MKKAEAASINYLEHIAEFITFLSVNDLTIDEILSHVVQVVLAPLNAEAIFMCQINRGNQAERVGAWGMPLEMFRSQGNLFNLNDRFPSTDALKFRKTTWVNTLPDWGPAYPLLKNLPYTTGAKTFICFPIEKSSTPVATLGVFSRDEILPNTEVEAFLKAVGSVFSMHMFRQDVRVSETKKLISNSAPTQVHSVTHELTERQHVILRLMSEDRTNFEIGEFLGYSESTIRQESITIFAKLNCTSRKEAARIYLEKFGKP
jgi:DNA-binding CsgD family transcriptional regulator